MRSIKNAKLGTYPDVSSFETPFSDHGRMSITKLRIFLNLKKTLTIYNDSKQ